MTKFLDGPAAGISLGLRRCPIYLRVVYHNVKKTWDALDQLEDKPSWDETVYAYKQSAFHGMVHVCRRPTGSGYFGMAEYQVIHPQPPRETLRSNQAWQEWCHSQPDVIELLKQLPAKPEGQ